MKKVNNIISNVPDLLKKPIFLIIAISVLLLSKIYFLGRLAYGDIPAFDISKSKINYLYSWGPAQLGTNVRQSSINLLDFILISISPSNYTFFFLKNLLPIILIPVIYYIYLKKLGVNNKIILTIGSLFPLFTPIVFGDFLNGQPFWIYLVIPWVFYFAIKIFCLHQFNFKNYILLGVMLCLSFGALPPIIVPLIILLVFFVLISYLITEPFKWRVTWNYLLASVTALAVFFILSAPYLLVASSGQSAYTSQSIQTDYYHNYSKTNLVNTLRLAGNNGNGQSILEYNLPSITNSFGYFILVIILLGFGVIIRSEKNIYNEKIVSLTLIGIMILILGLLFVLTDYKEFGLNLFESQWIVTTIRNPSKLYSILLPVITLLLAFSVRNIYESKQIKKYKVPFIFLIIVVFIGYGWPALRGDLGLFYGREDQVTRYKINQVDNEIAMNSPTIERSLMIPATHHDELNYQNINPGLNILRLEGGIPETTIMFNQMVSTFNNKNDQFFNYLEVSGIKNIYLKKSAKDYEANIFSLFPVTMTPESAREFLQSKIELVKENENYWHFQTSNRGNLVFSPHDIIFINGEKNIKNEAPLFKEHNAVVNEITDSKKPFVTQYDTYNVLDPGTVISEGKAILHEPDLIKIEIFSEGEGSNRKLILNILNPLSGTPEKTFKINITDEDSVVAIDGKATEFNKNKKAINARSGAVNLNIGSIKNIEIDKNIFSFEKNIPKNIISNNDSQSMIKSVPNSSDGSNAVELSSKNTSAIGSINLPTLDLSRKYLIKFDYKNVKGIVPTLSVRSKEDAPIFNSEIVSNNADWNTSAVFFDYSEYTNLDGETNDSTRLVLINKANYLEDSVNLIDNMKLHEVIYQSDITLELPSYSASYDLKNYIHEASHLDNSENKNILTNASFEAESLWGEVHTIGDRQSDGEKVASNQNDDSSDGSHSLELIGAGSTAYVTKTVTNFVSNRVYKLSLDYKHISGHNPAVTVWQNGSGIYSPSRTLKSTRSGWNTYETYFIPDSSASNLSLYLYSPSNGNKTVNLFDNVKIEIVSNIATYLEKKHDPIQEVKSIVREYEKINPTLIRVKAESGTGLLTFGESYHHGWKAYAVSEDYKLSLLEKLYIRKPGIELTEHIKVNHYANGWWVDENYQKLPINPDGEYEILLIYTPQKAIYGGFIMAAVGSLGVSAFLACIGMRSFNKSRKKRA